VKSRRRNSLFNIKSNQWSSERIQEKWWTNLLFILHHCSSKKKIQHKWISIHWNMMTYKKKHFTFIGFWGHLKNGRS